MAPPQFLFGCASVGKNYSTKEEVEELTRTLHTVGLNHLDTTARYPPTSPGLSEKLLGEAKVGSSFVVDTKILISGDGRGHLSEANIAKSIEQSYASLKVSKINILYCHGPDKQTPIADQAAAFDKFYREGKFTHLGVSNFSIKMLGDWLEVADKNNYVKPKYYQGQYNVLCRAYEDGLFPFLRRHGIHFIAFSPLAGGFLTGKLKPDTPSSDLKGTRFEVAENNPFGTAARRWYDKPSMYKVNEELLGLANAEQVPMEALALRWLLYHSALQSEDGIIIGASRPSQAQNTMELIKAGPLSENVAAKLSEVWSICGEDAQSIVAY